MPTRILRSETGVHFSPDLSAVAAPDSPKTFGSSAGLAAALRLLHAAVASAPAPTPRRNVRREGKWLMLVSEMMGVSIGISEEWLGRCNSQRRLWSQRCEVESERIHSRAAAQMLR